MALTAAVELVQARAVAGLERLGGVDDDRQLAQGVVGGRLLEQREGLRAAVGHRQDHAVRAVGAQRVERLSKGT